MVTTSAATSVDVSVRGRSATRTLAVRIEPSGERSEEHTSELQSRLQLVCRLLLEKKKGNDTQSVYLMRSPMRRARCGTLLQFIYFGLQYFFAGEPFSWMLDDHGVVHGPNAHRNFP